MLIQRAVAPERIEKYAKFQVSQFTHYERQRLKDKYSHLANPDPEVFLVGRLVQANLRRRQMFLYALSHHNKIAAPDIQESTWTVDVPQPVPRPGSETTATLFKPMTVDVPQPVPRPGSETTAPLFKPQTTDHGLLRSGLGTLLEVPLQVSSEYSDSEITSIASHASNEVLSPNYYIPPRPKSSDPSAAKTYSECPYCFKIIRISSERKWE